MSKTLVKILTFSTIATVVIGGFVAGIILPPDVALAVAMALAMVWFALSLARRSLLSMTSALWTLLALLSVLAGVAGFVLAGVALAGMTARPVFLERSDREEGAVGTGEESRARAVAAGAADATFAQVRKARRSRPEEGWKGPG